MEAKKGKKRRAFGKLPYSVLAGNAPQAALNYNVALVDRIARERAAMGWEPDANVAVPGPRRS